MSEKRKLKCIKLAIKAGATPENAVRIAKDFEQWVSEFSDPLKLDEQSPKVMDCYLPKWIGELRDPLKPDAKGSGEIDWSRPQLVTCSSGMVVKTNGRHTDDSFEGMPIVGGRFRRVGEFGAEFPKHSYSYYGEIQEPNTTGLTLIEAVSRLKSVSDYIRRSDWIPQFLVRISGGGGLEYYDGNKAYFTIEDILATDWQIINK
jgi:hypothetical protein